jgi:hypothetical protein
MKASFALAQQDGSAQPQAGGPAKRALIYEAEA